MRSKVAERILSKTPADTKIFVRLYADIVVRIGQLLKEQGLTQKDLAELMEKSPSEISKWLNGEHNFTLRSLARLSAELGEPLLVVPPRPSAYKQAVGKVVHMTAIKHEPVRKGVAYTNWQNKGKHQSHLQLVAS